MKRHAVIMAGGAGTRLWPLSREARPKQLLRLFGGKSLLRQSYERCRALLPDDSIYVITGLVHVDAVRNELSELPVENIFGEPCGRDTANAIGLAAAILHRRDPDGVMGIFTADHIITPVNRFAESIDQAFSTAENETNALVTLGIKPTSAHTGYGYIHRGEEVRPGVYAVQAFKEKPGLASATKYFESGDYSWNSGMFAWRLTTILEQLQKNLPQSYDPLQRVAEAWGTEECDRLLNEVYPKLIKISIDFAVMEHADRVLCVEMDCKWGDVGAWPALEAVIGVDSDGNVRAAQEIVNLGSQHNIIVSEDNHLIATIGVEDLIIVHSPDATLVCTKRDAQHIKELVERVRKEFGEQHL